MLDPVTVRHRLFHPSRTINTLVGRGCIVRSRAICNTDAVASSCPLSWLLSTCSRARCLSTRWRPLRVPSVQSPVRSPVRSSARPLARPIVRHVTSGCAPLTGDTKPALVQGHRRASSRSIPCSPPAHPFVPFYSPPFFRPTCFLTLKTNGLHLRLFALSK